MSKIVSVIVPVYRVEDYLSKCVESIVCQTYADLEIILVDDGSPDLCPKICDDWTRRDERIRVVHKQNGGLASARNRGMDIMTGDLFMFVDSDDYIDKDTVSYMVNGLMNGEADIVCCGIRKVYSNTYKIESDTYLPGSYEQEDAIKHLLLWDGTVRSYAWGKLFRSEKFFDIRFREDLKYGEDTPFIYEALKRARMIYQLPDIKYNYLQREDSLTGSVYTHKRFQTMKAAQIVSEECKRDFPELSNYADYHVAMNCYFVMGKLILSKAEGKYPEDYKFLHQTMKNYPILRIMRLCSLKRGICWGLVKYFPSVCKIKQWKR